MSRGMGALDTVIGRAMAGYVYRTPEQVAAEERRLQEERDAEVRSIRRERLASLRLEFEPETHEGIVRGKGLLPTRSLLVVERWIARRNSPPWIVLVGMNGCGKTVAAGVAVANYSGPVRWYEAPDVVRIFTASFGDQYDEQERMKYTGLLVINDVGTEGDPDRMGAAMTEINEKRQQRPTLMTTNQSRQSWLERYSGTALKSRLNKAVFVVDRGCDLRVPDNHAAAVKAVAEGRPVPVLEIMK